MKIQRKVTLLFLGSAVSIVVLLMGAIFYFAHEFAFEDFYKRLEARVNLAAQIYSSNNNDSVDVYREVRRRYLEVLPSEHEYIIKTKNINAKGEAQDLPPKLVRNILRNAAARFKKDNTLYAGRRFGTGDAQIIVVVSARDPYGLKELENLQRILITGFFIAIVVIYAIGKIFSYQMLKPVRSIIKRVKSITASNLHLRLEDRKGEDEIAELTQTFNDMLNRLETAFETQNNFVSNASHELRTPLAIIKGEVEIALKNRDEPGADHYKTYNEIWAATQSLQDILTSLLGLAQTGFDGKKQNWEDIRADELIWLIKEAVDYINPANKLSIDLSALPENNDLLKTRGNINLLKLALSNIALNACKYSDNKPVMLKLIPEKGNIIFSVKDEGIGIPQEEVQHIFEPFFRASNTGEYEGHGVGLPLALNIIRLHRGSIAILSKVDEGTEIRIMLPVVADDDEVNVIR
ncbi:HAMP domain-containing sensor histidine kinase [Mucilaginibacter gynuensis]|uniref:histidine kinase n=1 Tax=Mucilaginibacter gynuensis TaxID=1302236 RepID=A0ABP8HNJ0_9SPHI